MLLQDKIIIFNNIVNFDEKNYADSFNGYIELLAMNHEYIFLNKLDSENEIIRWLDKLKSRLVMNEDIDTIENIMDDYVEFG